jgi:hypothetical protein
MINRHLFLLFALLVAPAACFSQIVIDSTDLSGVGASYTWGWLSGATFEVGSGGADQTWTFGSYGGIL